MVNRELIEKPLFCQWCHSCVSVFVVQSVICLNGFVRQEVGKDRIV